MDAEPVFVCVWRSAPVNPSTEEPTDEIICLISLRGSGSSAAAQTTARLFLQHEQHKN